MKKDLSSKNMFFKIFSKEENIEQRISNNLLLNNILYILCCLFIFIVIFFMNVKTPMNGDDYVYSFLYQTPHRIASLNDIFESQYIHYKIWGGRNVVHFIAQIILFIKKPIIIDTINSLAFIALIQVICYHIEGKKKKSISILLIVFFLIWLLQPAFAETTLWITGSANYLWGTLILLIFLLPYRLYENKTEKGMKEIFFTTSLFIGGIIAGWTNENTAGATIVMCIAFMFYSHKQKQKTPLWMYMGLIGAIIGYVIMITAPGNFARAQGTAINPFIILYRFFSYTHSFIDYLGILNLGVAILLVIYLNNKVKNYIFNYISIFYIGIFISIYIMIASPGFPPRAWFGTIIFNIIIFCVILSNIDHSLRFTRQIKNSILIFGFITFSFSFYDAYNDITEIDQIWKERMTILEQKQKEQAKSVTFKMYSPKTKFGLGDTPYASKYISDYYNIDFQLEK